MKRLRALLALSALCGSVLVIGLLAPAAGAYGHQAVWQVGISLNCDVPHSHVCDQFNGTGGEWGWYEFDADGTGDAEIAGCGHVVGPTPPFTNGAGHFSLDFTYEIESGAPVLGPIASPNGEYFFLLGGTETDTGFGPPQTGPISADALGNTGIPASPGHYSFSPAPGVSAQVTVALKPTA